MGIFPGHAGVPSKNRCDAWQEQAAGGTGSDHGTFALQDGLTQEEVSERLQRNETSVALAVERLVQEGYLTFEGEALHLTDAGQAEAARTVRAMEETEKLALQDFTVEDIAQLHSLLERMHRNLQGKAPSGEQKPRLEY